MSPQAQDVDRGQNRDWTLQDVIKAVEESRDERWEAFKDQHGHPGRDQVLHLCRSATSLTLSELAKTFGVNHDATIAMAIRRYKNGLAKNPRERKMMEAAAGKLRIRM